MFSGLWVLVVQLAPGPSLAADQCSLELLQASAARAAEACTSVLNADETTTASRVAALKIRGRAMQRLDRYPDAIADYETGLRSHRMMRNCICAAAGQRMTNCFVEEDLISIRGFNLRLISRSNRPLRR